MKLKNKIFIIITLMAGFLVLITLAGLNFFGFFKQEFENGELKIFCWGEYLADGTLNSLNIIDAFEKETKIKVSVFSTFDSNEQMYTKLKNGNVDYDVILPSEYMVSRLIKEDLIQKLDFSLLKNYNEIMDPFKGDVLGYDPTNEYSVPFSWGTIGIIYNKELVKNLTNENPEEIITGWDAFFNKKLNNEILMFINSRDSFAIANKLLNQSINTENFGEIEKSANLLKSQKELVQAYVMDEMYDKMENNEAAISPAYSGDIVKMMNNNKNLAYCFPKEGSNIFVDALCIPKNSKNIKNAHKFIDFLCRPDIALENTKFLAYSTPVRGAFNSLDDGLKFNKIAYPPKEILKKCEAHKALSKDVEQKIETLWTNLRN